MSIYVPLRLCVITLAPAILQSAKSYNPSNLRFGQTPCLDTNAARSLGDRENHEKSTLFEFPKA